MIKFKKVRKLAVEAGFLHREVDLVYGEALAKFAFLVEQEVLAKIAKNAKKGKEKDSEKTE